MPPHEFSDDPLHALEANIGVLGDVEFLDLLQDEFPVSAEEVDELLVGGGVLEERD